jgi:AAHS family 4-hydroxybenzoate transporter-like MFS transporter
MTAGSIVDVGAVIDRSRFSRRQIAIVALCGLLMVLDGYDSGEIAFVGPSLLREWHLQPSMLTLLFTVNGITQIIAALFFGPVTDRYGRRWLMIGGTAFTGIASFASAYAMGPNDFLFWRILCALGLAGVMTNAVALGAEFAPLRARSFAVIALYCGFAVGQTLGAGIAAQLIPADGWRIVMIIGGVLPVAVAVICVPILPESIRFLALRRPQSPVIARELRKIDRTTTFDHDTTFISAEKAATARPMRALFAEGRATSTLLVWVVFVMNITGLIFLNSWVPTLLHAADVPLAQALRVAMVMQAGTIVSALFMAWCMDRWGAARVLVPAHLMGVIGLALFGQTIGGAAWLMFVMAAIMGAGIQGAQTTMIGFTAGLYPTAIRATGVGSAFGIGRIGTIIGPIYGGAMMSLALPVGDVFLLGAIPAAISSAAIIGLWLVPRGAALRRNAVSTPGM